jgi:two-component sensor histidine kinase
MTAFRAEAEDVRDGDLDTTWDKSTIIKEIRETADSFAEMKTGLRESRRQNTELTRGLEQSAQELRRKEIHLRATFTSLVNFSDALVVRDGAGNIRFANPAAEDLLGANPGRTLDRPMSASEGSDEVLELDGEGAGRRIVEVRVVPTEWEGQPASLIALRDITERRRMEEEIRWRADTLEALHEVALELATHEELPQLLSTLAAQASRLLGAKGAAVFLRKGEGEVLVEALRHNLGPHDAALELAKTQGAAGRVFDSGSPLIVNDYATWEGRWTGHQATDFNACIAAPIRWGVDILGVLLVGDDTPRTFHQGDVALLERFTPLAAAALEQHRLLVEAEDLYKQAQRDAETKTVLLQEVNHRVKNNLSAIIGLLYAEQRHAAERNNPQYREALRNLVSRVQSMAAVHELLTASEWSPLVLSALVQRIVESAVTTMADTISIRVRVEPSSLRVEPALANSIAMVVHELATNSVKHAFPGRDSGIISVSLSSAEPGWVTLLFRDDGPGYPEDVITGNRQNLGLHLLRTIVSRDLGGHMELRTDHGAATTLHIHLVRGDKGISHA